MDNKCKQNTTQSPTKEFIPLSVPELKGNEWKYVKECLDTNWVSSAGSFVERFEKNVAQFLGRSQAVACINGTAALHIALLVSGISLNEEVIMPALTFVAPANTILYTGAKPVFIDIDPETWQIDPQKIKDFITKECLWQDSKLINRKTKRIVRAILPVHLLGHPVDMDSILNIAKKFNLIVIADATESLGALYKEQKVGALADISCLSFNGNKIITSGGGGMLVTDNKVLADKAKYLSTQAKDDSLEYIHNEIGYNYRLTNIQAAMGFAQMESLDDFVTKKRTIAKCYSENLKDIKGISFMKEATWAKSNFWLYTILVNPDEYGIDSRSLLNKLKIANIQTRPLWCPLHNLKPFKDSYAYHIEKANKIYQKGLTLPSSVGLTDSQQERVIEAILENKN